MFLGIGIMDIYRLEELKINSYNSQKRLIGLWSKIVVEKNPSLAKHSSTHLKETL